MSSKQKHKEIFKEIDAVAAALAKKRTHLAALEQGMAEHIERIKGEYGDRIAELKAGIAGHEKDLQKFVKKNKAVLFDTSGDSDRAVTPAGAVIRWSVLRRAKRVKNKEAVIAALKQNGWYDQAVRVTESVDWDTIDHWPDAALAAIGSERSAKEEISVDTAGVKP